MRYTKDSVALANKELYSRTTLQNKGCFHTGDIEDGDLYDLEKWEDDGGFAVYGRCDDVEFTIKEVSAIHSASLLLKEITYGS